MRKKELVTYLVIIAILLVVLMTLVVLIATDNAQGSFTDEDTIGATISTEEIDAPSGITPDPIDGETQEPTDGETQELTQQETEEPTQEPVEVSADQQRIDSKPITDEETVLRLLTYEEELTDTEQVLLVLAEETNARVTLHEKGSDGLWHTTFVANGCVGKNGVGDVYEGSGMTPQGVYGMTKAFGIREDPGSILPYTQVNNSHYWVDDPDSAYYNRFVSIDDVKKDWDSAEHLIDYQTAYAYAIAIDYNLECVPGAGSAFFVHCSTGNATLGCVSVSEKDMLFLLETVGDHACIVIDRRKSADES